MLFSQCFSQSFFFTDISLTIIVFFFNNSFRRERSSVIRNSPRSINNIDRLHQLTLFERQGVQQYFEYKCFLLYFLHKMSVLHKSRALKMPYIPNKQIEQIEKKKTDRIYKTSNWTKNARAKHLYFVYFILYYTSIYTYLSWNNH